jgi:catechol 2,3-dioxygenase-like lactoylglutathione lyase family enzyme
MANNDDLDLIEIAQVALTVADLDRSIKFYRDVLGLSLLFTAPPGLAFFRCGGVRIMLASAAQSGSEEKMTSTLYFRVTDIHRSAEVLAKRGVTFERDAHLVASLPDHDLYMAFFRDPDHHLLALMSEQARRI